MTTAATAHGPEDGADDGARIERYVDGLVKVARSASQVAEETFAIDLARHHVTLVGVAPGAESISTDYRSHITVSVSCLDQLLPPPHGPGSVLYGVAHEIGHTAVARLLAPGDLPPVVWDEALAHHLAVHLLLPGLWGRHGTDIWPDPYPDWLEREAMVANAPGPEPAGHFGSYPASLRQLDRQVGRVRGALGWAGLGAVLGRVGPNERTLARFWPTVERLAEIGSATDSARTEVSYGRSDRSARGLVAPGKPKEKADEHRRVPHDLDRGWQPQSVHRDPAR